jgi:DNA primase
MRFDTDLIKSRLSCPDLLAMHGIETNRKGRARCCFHDDNRPSMAVFDDHVHCYACGAHADVIGLAEQLYSVGTAEAIRITAELAGIAAVSDTKDYADRAKKARMKATQRDTTIEALKRSYDKLLAEFVRLEQNKSEYAPRSPNDTELHPLFREALTRLDYVGYALQQCEWMILDAEKAR